jgi:hypothetical protein
MTDAISILLTRGNAAVEAIQQNPNTAATAAADAFQDLQVIREVLELAHGRKYGSALQVRVCWGFRGHAGIRFEKITVSRKIGRCRWGALGFRRHSGCNKAC